MSQVTYVLSNINQSPIQVGSFQFGSGITKTVTVEEDTPDDVSIASAVAAGLLSQSSREAVRTGEPFGYKEAVPYAASITPDISKQRVFSIGALTGGLTINAPVGSVVIGDVITFILLQDGVGGRAVTWNAIFKKSADGAGTANQAATKSFRWNGTNFVQEGGALVWL